MLRILFCLISIITFLSCHQPLAYTKFLNPNELQTQTISIDNSRDTALRTAKGALLQIAKESFSGEGMIQLEIKEAYSMADMVKGGLLTRSGGKTLTSGGMIYVSATDKDVRMVKPIGVSTPTEIIDPSMQLYKGEESEEGIDWTEPTPLRADENLLWGRSLYKDNCATCHAIDKNLTGPGLAHLEERGPWKDKKELYAFMQNPAAYANKNEYVQCQILQYGAIMQAFPQLDEKAIDAITNYVNSETLEMGIPFPKEDEWKCQDSCRRFDSLRRAYYETKMERNELIDENGMRIQYERQLSSTDTSFNSNDVASIPAELDKVVPQNYKAVYYQFDIQSFGWYNVDRLLEFNNGQKAELLLKIDETRTEEFDVFITIPQYKVFDRGGLLKDKDGAYGFYTTDGKIPLSIGTKVYVFVISEAEGKILFDYKVFISKAWQQIQLTPAFISKERLNNLVASFSLTDISFEAKDSKDSDAIRETDRAIKTAEDAIESLRPKNCRCDCTTSDSTKPATSYQ